VTVGNDSSTTTLNRLQVVPLTTNTARVYPREAFVRVRGSAHEAMADQLRTVAKERPTDQMGALTLADVRSVEQAIRLQPGLP